MKMKMNTLNTLTTLTTLKRCLHTFTTLNPKSIKFHPPHVPSHDSLLLVCTPSQISKVTQKLINEKDTLKNVFVGCIDSINGTRNGYSEFWVPSSQLKIRNVETTEERDQRLVKVKSDLSVDPIRMDKSWKDNRLETSLKINFGDSTILCRLANTLFNNGESSTCYYFGFGVAKEWYNIANVEIDIYDEDLGLDNHNHNHKKVEYFNRLEEIPMVEGQDESYEVTDFEGNLIKSINDESASGYLINNSIVMASKKDLYFQIGTHESPYMNRYYQLIVGGLGWGEKQAFLAIDPDVGQVGHQPVKLFYYNENIPKHNIEGVDAGTNRLLIECSNLQDSFESFDQPDIHATEIPGLFSIGAELGVQYNQVWHKSPGATLVLSR